MSDDLDLVRRAVEAGETIAAEKNRTVTLQRARIAQLEAQNSGNLWIAFTAGGTVGIMLGWWFG